MSSAWESDYQGENTTEPWRWTRVSSSLHKVKDVFAHPSIRPSVHPSIHCCFICWSICMCIYRSIYRSSPFFYFYIYRLPTYIIWALISPPVHWFVYLVVCLFVCMFVDLCICKLCVQSDCWFTHQLIHLSFYPFVCLLVCRYVSSHRCPLLS